MSKSPQRSTPRLSEAARHLVYPTTIAASVYPRVEAKLRSVGVEFDLWQKGFGTISLGLDRSLHYAATVGGVVASIPRQVGKTFTVGNLLIGLCLLFPGLRVIWTSHHGSTTKNTLQSMQGMVTKPKIAPLVRNVYTNNNDMRIVFTNGSTIMFGAREHGFGRGMDAIDVIVFDEAQKLGIKALEDMVPASNQARHEHGALIFFIGTPPRPVDDGEAFAAKRRQALEGNEDDDMVYVEFSADPEADPDDRSQWPIMNPSYPARTSLAAMKRMRKNLTDEGSWRREAMGIWDDEVSATTRLVSEDDWTATQTAEPPPDGIRSLAVVFGFENDQAALGGAVKHENGVHLELIGSHPGPVDIDGIADWLADRWRDTAMIAIAGGAQSKVLYQALRDRGVPAKVIRLASTGDYFAANAMLASSITSRTITVPKGADTDALEQSVAVSDKKVTASGSGWRWRATSPDGDHQPMEAISLALWAARTTKRRPGRKQVLL